MSISSEYVCLFRFTALQKLFFPSILLHTLCFTKESIIHHMYIISIPPFSSSWDTIYIELKQHICAVSLFYWSQIIFQNAVLAFSKSKSSSVNLLHLQKHSFFQYSKEIFTSITSVFCSITHNQILIFLHRFLFTYFYFYLFF